MAREEKIGAENQKSISYRLKKIRLRRKNALVQPRSSKTEGGVGNWILEGMALRYQMLKLVKAETVYCLLPCPTALKPTYLRQFLSYSIQTFKLSFLKYCSWVQFIKTVIYVVYIFHMTRYVKKIPKNWKIYIYFKIGFFGHNIEINM